MPKDELGPIEPMADERYREINTLTFDSRPLRGAATMEDACRVGLDYQHALQECLEEIDRLKDEVTRLEAEPTGDEAKAEPMTEKRLAEIREFVAEPKGGWEQADAAAAAEGYCAELLAEVDRLKAENEALRPLAEEMVHRLHGEDDDDED